MNLFVLGIVVLYIGATVVYVWRRQWPDALMCAGSIFFSVGLLINGVRG